MILVVQPDQLRIYGFYVLKMNLDEWNTIGSSMLIPRLNGSVPTSEVFTTYEGVVLIEEGDYTEEVLVTESDIYITDLNHQSLLIFKGNSSNLKANSLINILKNNDFEKKYQIESLEFINKRRWDINLYNDVKLMLSEEDPNKSIQNFISSLMILSARITWSGSTCISK